MGDHGSQGEDTLEWGVKSAVSTVMERSREEKQLFEFGTAEVRAMLSRFSVSPESHEAWAQAPGQPLNPVSSSSVKWGW